MRQYQPCVVFEQYSLCRRLAGLAGDNGWIHLLRITEHSDDTLRSPRNIQDRGSPRPNANAGEGRGGEGASTRLSLRECSETFIQALRFGSRFTSQESPSPPAPRWGEGNRST